MAKTLGIHQLGKNAHGFIGGYLGCDNGAPFYELRRITGKSSLLILAAVDVVCTFVMLMSGHFPGAINVPVSMLKRPAEDIIHGTRIYLYVTTVFLVAFFWFIIEATMLVAQGVWMGLPSIGIWSFIALLLGSVGIYFYWLWRG